MKPTTARIARTQSITVALICILTLLTGCSANPKPVVGSANQFDSDSYLTLVTADSVIQQTKASLAAGAFPVNIDATVKTALNALITAYDVANPIYIAYHNAALAGTATPVQQAAVNTAINSVNTATSNLVTAKGGN